MPMTGTMLFRLLITTYITAYVAAVVNRCFECRDIPHPADCYTIVNCPEDEMCILQQYITSGGLILYNSGCESKQRCTHSKRYSSKTMINSLVRREDITVCEQCCEGEFCNDQGCGTMAPKQPERGPMCFDCPFALGPGTCRTVDVCDPEMYCSIREVLALGDSSIPYMYETRCMSQATCAVLPFGRKRYNNRVQCCKDDYCNDEFLSLSMAANTSSSQSPTVSTDAATTTTMVVTTSTATATSSTTSTSTTTTPLSTTTTKTTPPSTTTTTKTTPPSTTTAKTTPPSTTTTTTKAPTAVPTTTETTTKTHPTTTITPQTVTYTHKKDKCVAEHHAYHYDANTKLCYRFYPEPTTWKNGNNTCASHGAVMATIDTREKWHFIQDKLFHDYHAHDVYIGARGFHNHYRWQNGHHVTFTAWAHGQPNDGHEDCVYIHHSDHQWHDHFCTNKYSFLCTAEV